MEGDGMIALVQGSRDAGLAVTLMSTAHLRDSLKSGLNRLSKSSVETSTVERLRTSTAVQIHDGQYSSSYQLAHCNVRPSSPPQRVTEFPLQRPAPSGNQSNFQVSGYGNENAYSPLSYSSSGQAHRRIWDQGSVSRLSPPDSSYQSRDPFVHSLRRYPKPLSPERSVSTELVQRLINYTQHKHLSKNANSLRRRSLREESSTNDKKTETTTNKNIQTYTRARVHSSDYGINTNNDIKFNLAKKGRGFSSTSPHNVRNKSDHPNDNYDYLKSSSRHFARHPEVRYLNDARKCIRDTIKQIYDDKPIVCPQIKSRYSHHQRMHHNSLSKHKTQHDEQIGFCKKPVPCPCKPDHSQEHFTPEMSPLEEVPTTSKVTKITSQANSAVCLCKKDDSLSNGKIADEVTKWLKDLPVYAADSPENKIKREEMVKDLLNKLKSLESDRDYHEKATAEIKQCIEKLPIWYPRAKRDQEMFMNQIIDDFFYRFAKVHENDSLKDVITQWLNRVLFTSKVDTNELLENLVKHLKPLINNLEEMKTEVKEMLQKLPIANKNKVINQLAEELANDLSNTAAKINDRLSIDSKNKKFKGQIMDWIEDVPELSSDIKETKDMVRKLAENCKKVQEQDLDDEERDAQMKEEVGIRNDSILQSKDKKMDSKTRTKLSNKLLNTSAALESNRKDRKSFLRDQNENKKPTSNLVDANNADQAVLSEISDLFEDIPNVSQSVKKQAIYKAANILPNNIDHLSDENGKMHREIVNILKREANMSNNEAGNLASTLIDKVKEMPSLDQSKSPVSRSSKTDDDIKQLVSNEICEIFNDYNLSDEIKKEVEKSIEEVLADQIVRGTDGKITTDKTISIFEDASKNYANDNSNKLLERSKDFSFSYSTQGSNSMSPMERENYEEKAEREILDFIADLTGNDSPHTRKKRKKQVKEIVHKLDELMSDPNESEKTECIMKQIAPYLQVILKDFDVPIKEAARKLVGRLQGIEIQTSTPKGKTASFNPKRDLPDISSIQIDGYDFVQKLKNAEEINDEVKKYVNKLTELISSWMDELPVDLGATNDNGFKETMINDLVGDIIDRQKYLQLNANAKSSNFDDIEHLKYQVFRWLNKLPDIDNISRIMQKTEALIRKIKEINAPDFVKLPRKQTEINTDYKTIQGLSPDPINSMKEIISEWLDKTFANLDVPKPTNIHFLIQMINDLAEKIQQYKTENELKNMSKEITDGLIPLVKDVDKEDITKMSETLNTHLDKEFAIDSLVRQDISQFVKENLERGIQDFIKSLPLYLKRNEEEKREIERIIPKLVEGIKSVLENAQSSTDTLLIEEIIRHVKKFPMDVELKSDEGFIQIISALLLQVIKDLQLFQNISERQDISSDKYLTAIVEDWHTSLLTPNENLTVKTKINKNLKKVFTETLKQIRQKDPMEDQKLKDAIRNYLLKLIDNGLKQYQAFIQDKVAELFKNLLAVPIDTTVQHRSDKFVEDAIGNFIKLLSLKKRKAVEEIPNDALEELRSAVTDLLMKTDNRIQISEIKKIFEGEIENVLKRAPLVRNATIDEKGLTETLSNYVNEVFKNVSDTEPVQNPSTVKKAADVLFHNIDIWCDNLPITVDTPEDIEKAKKVKEEMVGKLIRKIGKLHMHPEIFNNDFLYYDMLEDEIDNLVTDISSEGIKNNLPALKKDLMDKLKKVRQKTQEEAAGQNYKQLLRKEISKTFISHSPIPVEEKADFEILKDKLAEAFINLHYVGGDEELKNKYKDKINDEVNQFCNDYLKKVPGSPINTTKLNQDLYKALKSVPVPKEETVRDEVELAKIKDEINEWVKELPTIKTPEERMQASKMITVLAKKIHDIEKQSEKEFKPTADYDDKIRKEITKWVKKPPFNIDDAKNSQLIEKLMDKLKKTKKSRRVTASTRYSIESDLFGNKPSLETSKTSQIIQYKIPPTTLSLEDQTHLQEVRERSSPPAAMLFGNIESSCDNLPITADTSKDIENVKEEIVSKLIHKIGELLMNPEVFNNDFLYYDMIEDEIENLLTDLSSENIKNDLPALKMYLIEKVKEVRQNTQEEIAGQKYKQLLRREISKTFLSHGRIPLLEEKADFEILKDNLADAFINLHYVGGNEELKNKYKDKINNEVNKFCKDYLKKHPYTPIDTKNIHQTLYKALKSVSVPKEETVRDEVELAKIKDEINEWVKELPTIKTPEERMQASKMITVLAKKIHDIEKQSEKEFKPTADYDDKIRKEITKWVKKPPFNLDDAKDSQLIEKLMDKLTKTKKARRLTASTRCSIESNLFDNKPSVESSKTSQTIQYTIPSATLSLEDQTHLQEVRNISSTPRAMFPPSKDDSVSPLPVDAGSQTEVRSGVSQPTCSRRLSNQSSGVQTQKPPEQNVIQAVDSQTEVIPHVIIREYYWDTLDGSQITQVLSSSQFPTPSMSPQIGYPRPMASCPSRLAASESMTPQKVRYQRQMASTSSQATPGLSPPMAKPPGFIEPQTPGQAQRPMSHQPSPCSRCLYLSPQTSVPDAQTPIPQPRRPRQEWAPCCRREMPGVSTKDQPKPGTSRPRRIQKPRVTRLGSFDTMHPQSTLSKTEWKFPEEDEFWGDKRRLASDEDGPFLKERKKVEEKSTCRCREMIVTKCFGRRRGKGCHGFGQPSDEVKKCSKCCGIHCPHPSYMYFRQ